MSHSTTARSGTGSLSTDTRRKLRRGNIEHEGPSTPLGPSLIFMHRHNRGFRRVPVWLAESDAKVQGSDSRVGQTPVHRGRPSEPEVGRRVALARTRFVTVVEVASSLRGCDSTQVRRAAASGTLAR